MLPLLPILLLLLMGPANAERLAAEGRLPAGLLAIHLAHVAPVRATVIAPVEETERTAEYHSAKASRPSHRVVPWGSRQVVARSVFRPACPTRAGPWVA